MVLACDLSPDIPCTTDKDCPTAKTKCFKKHCFPTHWVNRVKKLYEEQNGCRYCSETEDICIDISQNDTNCGKCNRKCPTKQLCTDAKCQCAFGLEICSTGCVELQSNPTHCGKCGNACKDNQVCYQGKCIEGKCEDQTPALATCGKACANLRTSPQHCGTCGESCRPDQFCIKGKCACSSSTKECGDRCVDLQVNKNHCGGCGKACAKGTYCAAGSCVAECPKATSKICFGGCFNTNTSTRHCGKCGNRCKPGEDCINGTCQVPTQEHPPSENQFAEKATGDAGESSEHQEGKNEYPEEQYQPESPAESIQETVTEKPCVRSQETCNGKDDDCDGTVDNNLTNAPDCKLKDGVCKGLKKRCVRGKWQDCQEADYQKHNTKYEAKETACDSLDNDCDGKVDQITKPCYTGPANTKKVGTCKEGTSLCKLGKWETCQGQVTPQKEDCTDGLDNDCNGKINNGCICKPGEVKDCGSAQGECKKGKMTCLPKAEWGPCTGQIGPSTETCDGKDNDCDGKVDGMQRPCYTGSSSALGKGICKQGKQTCSFGNWNPLCLGQVLPKPEACDGIDNDCNGLVDESISNPPSCTKTKGVCVGSKKTCVQGKWKDCTDADYLKHDKLYQASEDKCDSKDNDCDGKVDYLCVYTVAGVCGKEGLKNGDAKTALFREVIGLAFDSNGNLLITDTNNNQIRLLNVKTKKVITYSGDSTAKHADGNRLSARYHFPVGMTYDHVGNLYITDTGNFRIRKVDPQGYVSSPFGSGKEGRKDGQNKTTQFSHPIRIRFYKQTLYIIDDGLIRKMDLNGKVTTITHNFQKGFKNSTLKDSQFNLPADLVINSKGIIFVTDLLNHRIRTIDLSKGTVSTFSGSGTIGVKDGSATTAQFMTPGGMAIDKNDNLYVGEYGSIRLVKPNGSVTLLAGGTRVGNSDGYKSNAKFQRVAGLAFDSKGDLYVADQDNYCIRKLILK